MSYHIIINNNQNVTYRLLLKNSFITNDVRINGNVETENVVVGYNKFYLENESSRGLALTVSYVAYDVKIHAK